MGALPRRQPRLLPRQPGRVRAEAAVPAPIAAAASYPAGLGELQAKHRERWLIDGELGGYRARRVDYGPAEEPVLSPLTVCHATAQGLDMALTALSDCR